LAALRKEETLICIAEPENVRIINALANMQIGQYLDFTFLQYPALFNPALIEKNMSEISAAWELLCDEESKETFLSVLEYRITGDPMRLRIAKWPQYFHPIVKPRKNDVIIDGGAFIGDTALEFANCLDRACTIFSFEPGPESHQALQDTIKINELENVVMPVKAGLWDETGQLVFDDSLGAGARINGRGDSLIEVVDLNSFIQRVGIKPTLIKLDVEGAETRVLKGAEDFITRHLPRLQVCVYHLPGDLWEIPLFLNRLSGKYRIFLGHHWLGQAENWNFCETVAYAIAE
jgi:FkbM family methyltransferase